MIIISIFYDGQAEVEYQVQCTFDVVASLSDYFGRALNVPSSLMDPGKALWLRPRIIFGIPEPYSVHLFRDFHPVVKLLPFEGVHIAHTVLTITQRYECKAELKLKSWKGKGTLTYFTFCPHYVYCVSRSY